MVESKGRRQTTGSVRDGGGQLATAEVVEFPSGWTVPEYETGPFGFTNVDGVDATFVSPDGSLRLSAYPVSFERQGGRETISGVTLDRTLPEERESRSGPANVPPMTGFALGAYYEVGGSNEYTTFTILADGYDPVVVAGWLASILETGADFEAFHEVTWEPTTPALQVGEVHPPADKSGVMVRFPLRYAGYIDDWPTYESGIPVVPPTAGYLTTTVPEAVIDETDFQPEDVAGFPVVRDGETAFDIGQPPTFVRELTVGDVRVESLAEAPQTFL